MQSDAITSTAVLSSNAVTFAVRSANNQILKSNFLLSLHSHNKVHLFKIVHQPFHSCLLQVTYVQFLDNFNDWSRMISSGQI